MATVRKMDLLVEEVKKHCDSCIECTSNVLMVRGLEGEIAEFRIHEFTDNEKIRFTLLLYSDQGPYPVLQQIFINTTLATHQFIRLVAAADVAYMPIFKTMLKLKAFKIGFGDY